MRETSDYGVKATGIELPPAVVDRFLDTRRELVCRSAIVWGEHCTECAWPACYSTCSLYTPRVDHQCRRFAKGIERVESNAAPTLDLQRIGFRMWAKLEGRGPATLLSTPGRVALQRLDWLADAVFGLPAPRRVKIGLARRWNAAKSWLAGRGIKLPSNSCFMLETWNPGAASYTFTLSIVPATAGGNGMFQTGFAIEPGYNCIRIPTASMRARVDIDSDHLIQIQPVGDGGTCPIVFGILDFVQLRDPAALQWSEQRVAAPPLQTPLAQASVPKGTMPGPPKIKCMIWDLDNTLWTGTLVEDGIEGLTVNPAAVAVIRDLDRRGILNSVASKNDPEAALAALGRFGLREYFVFPQISWGPKSAAIREISRLLDVGLDTFAFIDDQPFERGEVMTLLPEVQVHSEADLGALFVDERFNVPITAEASNRRVMYQTEERRQRELAETGLDYQSFLRSCKIKLKLERLSPANANRIYELTQRTNQLNFSGRRYTQGEIANLQRPQRLPDSFVLRCEDRFGDYGIIGFCVLDPATLAVESFFMSCRVQRKRVENAFFMFLASELQARGVKMLTVNYRSTAKNHASLALLEELQFAHTGRSQDADILERDIARPFESRDVVEVVRAWENLRVNVA